MADSPTHPSHPHRHADDHHAHAHAYAPVTADADQAEVLDLDALVLAEHLATITAWLPVRTAPSAIVDLGSGTGAGTFALLTRFPTARVVAVDTSAEHLGRLKSRARDEGTADRVRTVQVDLEASDWPDLGTPDLVWASASLHHLSDPDRVLRRLLELLAPGGLFAVVELAGLPRFLPVDAPSERPGLEDRCHAATDRAHGQKLPHRGIDWGPELTAAGFTVEGERTLEVNIPGSGDGPVGRYASAVLRRLRIAVADMLPTEDLAALDRLLDPGDPEGILHRNDLAVRTERRVWAARAR